LGSVLPHGNGFRVHARVNGSQVKGPYRLTWARANADLHRAQSAQTHEEYAYILEQLRSEANLPASADASSRAVSGVVPPAAGAQALAQPKLSGGHTQNGDIAFVPSSRSGGAHPATKKARLETIMKCSRQMDPSTGVPHTVVESVPQPGQTDPCDGAHLAGKAGHTKCVTQAAVSDCLVVARVVKTPWCDDVAAGLKFFECVGNQKTRRINPFNSLKAGDLCVVVRSKDNKKVTAVAEVQGPQRLEQTDRSLLLQHLQPGRHDEIQNFLGDAPSFNVVFFSKVYDCSHLNLTLPSLVRQIPGLQEPGQLAGAPALNTSEDSQQRRKELRDAVEHFLTVSECPLRFPDANKPRRSARYTSKGLSQRL